MDSQDSTGPPQHHHSHHHQPPQHHHHPGLVGPTPQGAQPHQQLPPTNPSYLLPNNNNSLTPATTTMMHHHQQQQQQNPRFSFNSLDHHSQYPDGSPSGSGGGGGGAQWFNMEQPVAARKKRGRPRKYSPDDSIGLGLASPVSQNVESSGGGGGTGTPTSDGNPGKRHRGRPPGSGKRQMDALGSPGVGFTPHVITVEAGEDIASKIMAFSQQGPRTVCILSANGAVCNVTLRQPAMSGGTVTYEGRFEIISLSGSFLPSESNNDNNRSGVLSVSLAGSDGRVLGGGVAGMLKAASPIQVVVGSFIAEGKKPKTGSSASAPPPPPSNMLGFGGHVGGTGASPTSADGGSSDSDDEDNDGSPPLDRGSGPYNPSGNSAAAGQQPIPQNLPMYSNMGGWPNSMKMHGP